MQMNVDERRKQNDRIEAILQEWTQSQEADSLMHALQHVGVTAAVLNTGSDLLKDPQLIARGYMQFIERDFVGVQPHPSAPWRTGSEPIQIRSPAPTLGQHNQLVLGGMLGLSQSELGGLADTGVIGNKPRLP